MRQHKIQQQRKADTKMVLGHIGLSFQCFQYRQMRSLKAKSNFSHQPIATTVSDRVSLRISRDSEELSISINPLFDVVQFDADNCILRKKSFLKCGKINLLSCIVAGIGRRCWVLGIPCVERKRRVSRWRLQRVFVRSNPALKI